MVTGPLPKILYFSEFEIFGMAVTLQSFNTYIGQDAQNSDSQSDYASSNNPQAVMEFQSVSDTLKQQFIDVAKATIKDMCGYLEDETLPDNVRVDMAIHFLALYYLQNRSTQEKTYEFSPEESLHYKQTSYYRRLDRAVFSRVNQLICNYRKVKRFIPHEVEGGGSYARAT